MTLTSDSASAEIACLRERLEQEQRARLEAEALATRSQRELRCSRRELELLRQSTVALGAASTIEEGLRVVLDQVCASTGWPLGHAYLFVGAELVSTQLWHVRERERYESFIRLTETTAFAPDVGLPGRALASGSVVWIPDMPADFELPRARLAATSGLRAACAFPVVADDSVAAVLEFFSDRSSEPDAALLHLLPSLGALLGRLIERKRIEEQLAHDAFHDALTGLANRSLFMDRLGLAVRQARRRDHTPFAVLFLDVDRFKVVTDSLGHVVGDRLLVALSRRLEGCLRPADTIARLGGDEFAILLPDVADPSDASRVATRIQNALATPWQIEGHEVFATVSIGIAMSSTGYDKPEDILRDADTAMYRAKALGRARHEVFDRSMHERAVAQLQLETDLRRALERGEFCVHYQPIVSLASGTIGGFEALVRWQHPQRGLVGPDEFVPVAEETGVIVTMSYFVLFEACQQMRLWRERFPDLVPLSVSVNLSPRLLAQPDLVEQVASALERSGWPGSGLKLEITESAIIDNAERAAATLHALKQLGIELSLDDFGTGYSSLSYLHRLPLDILKIDRAFVSRITPDGRDAAFARTIATLGHQLGMSIVAEGVETAEQLLHLRGLGCEAGQGYLFSRPVPPEVIEALLDRWPRW